MIIEFTKVNSVFPSFDVAVNGEKSSRIAESGILEYTSKHVNIDSVTVIVFCGFDFSSEDMDRLDRHYRCHVLFKGR